MKKQNKLPLIHISQFYGMNWFQISTELGRSQVRVRVCRDGRGMGSKLVLFAIRFSKHPHISAIFKVDSE